MSTTTTPSTTWTPANLLATFCDPARDNPDLMGFKMGYRDDAEGYTWQRGFCCYAGKDSYGPGIDGFDDGADLMDALYVSGWERTGDGADGYLSFTMLWTTSSSRDDADGQTYVAVYCEGDFGLYTFDTGRDYRTWVANHKAEA